MLDRHSGTHPLPTSYWRGIRFFDSGDVTSGHVVVLVHGLGNSLQFWAATVPLLRQSARVVAMDLPGFGRSRPLKTNDLESYVAVLTEFLRFRRVTRHHVVGHSMGSVVAGALATYDNGSAESLLLLSGVPFAAIDMIRSPRLALRDASLATNIAAQFIGGSIPLGQLGARLISRHTALRRLTLWPFVKNTRTLSPDAAAVALRDNGGLGPARVVCLSRGASLSELLPVPPIPVRVLLGQDDRLVNKQDLYRTVRHYDAIDSLIVEDTGHWPLLEAPKIVASYITDYLK